MAILGIVLVVFFMLHLRYNGNLKSIRPNDEVGVIVEIPTGSTSGDIAKILKEKDLIRSEGAFVKYTKKSSVATSLKAGTVLLRASMTVPEMVEIIKRGFSDQVVLTIPEGITVQDLDDLLASKGLVPAGDIVTCAKTCDFSVFSFLPQTTSASSRGGRVEGYLFPDTYFVVRDTFTAKSFLERLLNTFQSRVVEGLAGDLSSSKHSLHEIITMASLIEEETRKQSERATVSGILWKRLESGMRLDVDAAVRYALAKKSDAITVSDLESSNPYNLRKVGGLPPGPIASPGISSIKAALHPEESDYFYYLHGTDGQIRYAATNDEHNLNRSRYLR